MHRPPNKAAALAVVATGALAAGLLLGRVAMGQPCSYCPAVVPGADPAAWFRVTVNLDGPGDPLLVQGHPFETCTRAALPARLAGICAAVLRAQWPVADGE